MLLVLVALLCVVASTQAQCLSTRDDVFVEDREAYRDLVRSQVDFSVSLLKLIGSQQPSENIFISPHSVYSALLLAYFASRGHTENSLRQALFIPNRLGKHDMLKSYQTQRQLGTFGEYKSQVNVANHLFISKEQTIGDCMKTIFGPEIEQVDFSPSGLQKAVDTINNWIAKQTKNNILNLISAESLNPNSQLILANAAYFKGLWTNEFKPEDTKLDKFYITQDNAVTIPMMYQHSTFKHWRSDKAGAEIVELPYKGYEISMIILLPDPTNKPNSATELLQRIDSGTLLQIMNESTDERNEDEVDIKLPKFAVEKTYELTSILEELGVGDLFRPTSNLTGITDGPRIQLNSAIHKAKIQVDEKGTEAAAATVLIDTRISSSGFVCNRPFLYMIYDKKRTVLLFAGIYNDPSKK